MTPMPIWLMRVSVKPSVNMSGSTIITRAVLPQTIQRPRLSGLYFSVAIRPVFRA